MNTNEKAEKLIDNVTVFDKVVNEMKYLGNLQCILEKIQSEGVLSKM